LPIVVHAVNRRGLQQKVFSQSALWSVSAPPFGIPRNVLGMLQAWLFFFKNILFFIKIFTMVDWQASTKGMNQIWLKVK
jgi:hypothetical protein